MCDGAKRAVRLVCLRDLLFRRPYSVAELARICGTSERTIRRDLLDLELPPLNVALLRTNDGRYQAFDPNMN